MSNVVVRWEVEDGLAQGAEFELPIDIDEFDVNMTASDVEDAVTVAVSEDFADKVQYRICNMDEVIDAIIAHLSAVEDGE